MSFIERARREQIIDATIEVLAEQGYRHASLGRIAEQAGISKGLISYHFESRDDLMRQTLYSVYERITQQIMTGIDLTAAPPLVLRELIVRSTRIGLAERKSRHAAMEIMHNFRDSAQQQISFAEKDAVHAGIEHLYRAGQESGHFRDFDVRTMAVLYQNAIDGAFLYLDSHPETNPEIFAQQLADLLQHAVADNPKG